MTKVTIPASIDEAISKLNGIERLLMATEWEKAAIVAAFVSLAEGKGKAIANAGSSISVTEFAALGITGLKSKDTVRRYVDAWGDRPKPKPGQQVTLPTGEFPKVKTKEEDIKQQRGAVAKSLDDEGFRKKVIDDLSPEARKSLAAEIIEESTWEEIEDISDMSGSVITTQKSDERLRESIEARAKRKDKLKDSPDEAMALTIHLKDLVAKTNGRPWRVEVLLKWRDYIDEVLGLESAPDVIPADLIEGR